MTKIYITLVDNNVVNISYDSSEESTTIYEMSDEEMAQHVGLSVDNFYYDVDNSVVKLYTKVEKTANDTSKQPIIDAKEIFNNLEQKTTVTHLSKDWTFSEKRMIQFANQLAIGDDIEWTADDNVRIVLSIADAKSIARLVRDAQSAAFVVWKTLQHS